ncbi:hypothetical protein MTP99_006853 [Tenebrio molitor]|jgi:hypothetical protein|nr:hypothetical protein MTP99_006853 [Tenebrio molitor]
MFQTAQREKLNRNARPTLLLPRNGNENRQAVEAPLLAPSVPDQPQDQIATCRVIIHCRFFVKKIFRQILFYM